MELDQELRSVAHGVSQRIALPSHTTASDRSHPSTHAAVVFEEDVSRGLRGIGSVVSAEGNLT